MSESTLIDHMVAYYLAGPANDLSVAPRFYPRGELELIFEDKISVAVRRFGTKVRSKSKVAGKQFIDVMIEKGAWSTKHNDYGGSMHAFQPDAYKAALKELQDGNPLTARARAEGPEFWDKAFAELVA